METDAFLTVGEIVGVHGVRGTLKVRSDVESAVLLAANRAIRINTRQGDTQRHIIQEATTHKTLLLVTLEGVRDRDAAERLVGCRIQVPKAVLPPLEADEYYWSDLLGLAVYERDGSFLGRVDAIMATGSNDVYVVRDGNTEILIPALASVVTEIDLRGGRMVVMLPEGL